MSSNMYRDVTIEPARARHLQTAWSERVRALSKQTSFSKDDLQALCLVFHKICEVHEWWGMELAADPKKWGKKRRRTQPGHGGQVSRDRLDRLGFRDSVSPAFDMPDVASLDALFSVLDPNNKRYITMVRWARAVSALRGAEVEKANMCWNAYSYREDGIVNRNDMVLHVRNMFPLVEMDDFDGFCKEFVDAILKDTRAIKEGHMTLQEYLDIVSKRPLFREFLMDVLPSREAITAFLTTFSSEDAALYRPGRGRKRKIAKK